MSFENKLLFKLCIIGASIVVGLMIAFIINQTLLYDTAGWSYDSQFVLTRVLVIAFGIIFPAVIIVLSIIGINIYENSEHITLIFGILITILSGFIILEASLGTIFGISDLISYPTYLTFYIVQEVLGLATLGMGVLTLVGGIKNITYR